MSRWHRGPNQLAVVAKKVNNIIVGYQLSFVEGEQHMKALRKNVTFQSKSEAVAMLEQIEKRTEQYDTTYDIVERGKIRR